jgi:hypothetical protein
MGGGWNWLSIVSNGNGISSVEPSGSATRVLIHLQWFISLLCITKYKRLIRENFKLLITVVETPTCNLKTSVT